MIKEQMQEEIQSCCQPLTYLEQQVILHRARNINSFLLLSVLQSGIFAAGVSLWRKQLQNDKA